MLCKHLNQETVRLMDGTYVKNCIDCEIDLVKKETADVFCPDCEKKCISKNTKYWVSHEGMLFCEECHSPVAPNDPGPW